MRIVNRLLAALLALALIIVGLLVVIEVAAARLGRHPALIHWHTSYAWLHRTALATGQRPRRRRRPLVVGLLLLIAELKPARVSRLAVAATTTAAPDDVALHPARGQRRATRRRHRRRRRPGRHRPRQPPLGVGHGAGRHPGR